MKSDSSEVSYIYDPSGNRVTKTYTHDTATVVTRYARDASGNVMAIYDDTTVTERPIYGSSRLGMLRGTAKKGQILLGLKSYELSNHLGNVLTVVTDQKVGVSTDSDTTTIEHFAAQVVSVTDYYPFGLAMEGRTYTDNSGKGYRFGFNGKERDHQMAGATVYDYGFRIYSPVIAKFLSVDPLAPEYPWYTPYQFAGNMPIAAIDLDGLEEMIVIFDHWAKSGKTTITIKHYGDEDYKFYKRAIFDWVSHPELKSLWKTDRVNFNLDMDKSQSSWSGFTYGVLRIDRYPGAWRADEFRYSEINVGFVDAELNRQRWKSVEGLGDMAIGGVSMAGAATAEVGSGGIGTVIAAAAFLWGEDKFVGGFDKFMNPSKADHTPPLKSAIVRVMGAEGDVAYTIVDLSLGWGAALKGDATINGIVGLYDTAASSEQALEEIYKKIANGSKINVLDAPTIKGLKVTDDMAPTGYSAEDIKEE